MKNPSGAPLRLVLFLTLFSFFAGCMGRSQPLATRASSVEPGETIVVCKIVISPPLDDIEQSLKTVKATSGGLMVNPSASRYKDKVVLLTGKKLQTINDPKISDYRGRIEAPIGETFYARIKNDGPVYVNRSEIMMDLHRSGMEKAILPSGYKVDIRKSDKAVYLGTITYYRDEFFEVSRIQILDEYEKEAAAFRKKFGAKMTLRKALVSGKPGSDSK